MRSEGPSTTASRNCWREQSEWIACSNPLPSFALTSVSDDDDSLDWGHMEFDATNVATFDLAEDPDKLTYGAFCSDFARGRPVVVSGVKCGEEDLTPQSFADRHADVLVRLVDTRTDEEDEQPTSVGEYLASFVYDEPVDNVHELKKLKVCSTHLFRAFASPTMSCRIFPPRITSSPPTFNKQKRSTTHCPVAI